METNYPALIHTLQKMSEISRPEDSTTDDRATKKQKRIMHGICDLMEDAAVALNELYQKVNDERRDVVETARQ